MKQLFVFSKSDLMVKQVANSIDYNINLDEETNGVSTFLIEKKVDVVKGDIVYYDNFLFLVSNTESEKDTKSITISCVDINGLFDRNIIEKDVDMMTDNSLEEFLAQMIADNFLTTSDTVINIPYIDITINTQTQITEPTNSENQLYNLKTFIVNCRKNKSIYTEFSLQKISGLYRIKIDITNRSLSQVLIDATVAEVVDYIKVYDIDVVAKVECFVREDNTTRYLYLTTTGTTDNPSATNRVAGRVETISVDTNDNATDEMENVFTNNKFKHLIEFGIKKTSKLVDVAALQIGSLIKIKTKDDVYDSYISAISYSDNEIVSLKTGQLRVTLTDKLAQAQKSPIGNKIDIKGGVIDGTLKANGFYDADGNDILDYHSYELLPDGDATSISYWQSLTIKTYWYAYDTCNVTSVPSNYGIVSVYKGGTQDRFITYKEQQNGSWYYKSLNRSTISNWIKIYDASNFQDDFPTNHYWSSTDLGYSTGTSLATLCSALPDKSIAKFNGSDIASSDLPTSTLYLITIDKQSAYRCSIYANSSDNGTPRVYYRNWRTDSGLRSWVSL